jgi:hypothetical protein
MPVEYGVESSACYDPSVLKEQWSQALQSQGNRSHALLSSEVQGSILRSSNCSCACYGMGLFQLHQFTSLGTINLSCVRTVLFVTVYCYRNRRVDRGRNYFLFSKRKLQRPSVVWRCLRANKQQGRAAAEHASAWMISSASVSGGHSVVLLPSLPGRTCEQNTDRGKSSTSLASESYSRSSETWIRT